MRDSFLNLYDLKFFEVETLTVQSQVLRKNPLKDPSLRHNPILLPRRIKKDLPVIIILSGFTGSGPKSFGVKPFESNIPQSIDKWFYKNKDLSPLVVFIDTMTCWGGSQFINSRASGLYEDYVMKEILPAIEQNYSVKSSPKYWCLMGGSSGGYGALHLASRFPKRFGLAAALAPDSAFDLSLLPEIYSTLPTIHRLGSMNRIKKMMAGGHLQKQRNFHNIVNVIGMAHCYSKNAIEFPIDSHTGILRASIWREWKRNDPLVFLKKRQLKGLQVLLDVGSYDEFNLQYGARHIYQILKEQQVSCHYSEFDGGHFDLSSRHNRVWEWLSKIWPLNV